MTKDALYAIVDMGTTNTRLFLVDRSGEVLESAHGEFGVKSHAISGQRSVLIEGLNQLITASTDKKGISVDRIECLFCSGMITSEIGLAEIPHCIAPVGIADLVKRVRELSIPEILPAPIYLIPGVKNRVDHPSADSLAAMDFMRGEETQSLGAIDFFKIRTPATLMYLSSHTKLVEVDHNNRISGSFTTISGQVFSALRSNTVLASSLKGTIPDTYDQQSLFRGVRAGLTFGILRAGLHIRFMDTLIKSTPAERFAFLEGIIIGSDLRALKAHYRTFPRQVLVLGEPLRAHAYLAALQEFLDFPCEFSYLGANSMEKSALQGTFKIAQLYLRRH